MLSATIAGPAACEAKRAGSGGPLRDRVRTLARYVVVGTIAFAASETVLVAVGPAKRDIVSFATRAITPLAVAGAFLILAGGAGLFLVESPSLTVSDQATNSGRRRNIDGAAGAGRRA